jgi:heme O synthase-like polyprenyltransferase
MKKYFRFAICNISLVTTIFLIRIYKYMKIWTALMILLLNCLTYGLRLSVLFNKAEQKCHEMLFLYSLPFLSIFVLTVESLLYMKK